MKKIILVGVILFSRCFYINAQEGNEWFLDLKDQLEKRALFPEENAHLYLKFIKEIEHIKSLKNPGVNPDISHILVFSGRGSYLKNPIDRPDVDDPEDDHNRMRLGITTGRQIAALRLGKNEESITLDDIRQAGPIIIYNGRPRHNEDLKIALNDNILVDYPHDNFLILDIAAGYMDTRGNLLSIQNKLNLSNQKIALVTSAYHFPRIGRMISEKPPFNYFGDNVKIFAFLYDRMFNAPGAKQDLQDEAQKVVKYYAKGDLNQDISSAFATEGLLR